MSTTGTEKPALLDSVGLAKLNAVKSEALWANEAPNGGLKHTAHSGNSHTENAHVSASTDKSSVHAQRSTMISRIEELLHSYGLNPALKPALLAALDKLHTAHTNAEILAVITNVSSTVATAETALPETTAAMTFAEFEKKFDVAWNTYDKLEKETRLTMEDATKAGYISQKDEDKSKQEQKAIEEHKNAIDVLRISNQQLPEGVEKEKLQEEIRQKTLELAKEIIQHANHDKALIKKAIETAIGDHDYALAKELEAALPKKDEETQAGNEMYDFAITVATDKRRVALEKMKQVESPERSVSAPKLSSALTDTDLNIKPPTPSPASEDLPPLPPKPASFVTIDATHSSLGDLSPPSAGQIPRSSNNGIA